MENDKKDFVDIRTDKFNNTTIESEKDGMYIHVTGGPGFTKDLHDAMRAEGKKMADQFDKKYPNK